MEKIISEIEMQNMLGKDYESYKKQLDYFSNNLNPPTHYYDEKEDLKIKEEYYQKVRGYKCNGKKLFKLYRKLITKSHINHVPYSISKNQFLYNWVDLHPDGKLKNIYSGEIRDPETVIQEDFMKHQNNQDSSLLDGENPNIVPFKFNAEHVVPQSWYRAKEPMKGDLHQLFTCHPKCNTLRANFPYGDFPFYNPELEEETIRNNCGIAKEEHFEPEYGKGAVARATLYFLLRYPNTIHKKRLSKINIPLLIDWHERFPVSLYEKHRNQAIYHIQGNRNPFIDDEQLARRIFDNKN